MFLVVIFWKTINRSEYGHTFHDWEFDDDDDENISVYDAALIWQSNGENEDYTFGYTESELRRALR